MRGSGSASLAGGPVLGSAVPRPGRAASAPPPREGGPVSSFIKRESRRPSSGLAGPPAGDGVTMPPGARWASAVGAGAEPAEPGAEARLRLWAPGARWPGSLRASRPGRGGPGVPEAFPEPVSADSARTWAGQAGPPEPSSRELERPGRRLGLATAASREGRGRRGRRLRPEAEEVLGAGSGA